MAKLCPMERKRFTSPVAMMDALAHNIKVLADEAGVEVSTGFSVVRFVPAFGEPMLTYTVTVGSAVFKSDSNGYVDVVLETGVKSDYTISAEGYEDVTGSLTPEVLNLEVHLSRFVEKANAAGAPDNLCGEGALFKVAEVAADAEVQPTRSRARKAAVAVEEPAVEEPAVAAV